MSGARRELEALARELPHLEGRGLCVDPSPRPGPRDATPGREAAAEDRRAVALRALGRLEALWATDRRDAVRALWVTYVATGQDVRAQWTTGWGRRLALLLLPAPARMAALADELRAGQGPAAHGLEAAGVAALGAAETAYAEAPRWPTTGAWTAELREWLARSEGELATAGHAAAAERATKRAARKARKRVSETESRALALRPAGMETQSREAPGAEPCPEPAA